MRKILAVAVIVVAGVFMFSAPSVMAQEPCESDFTCDGDVDADDVATFLEDFGRFEFNNPCPDCYDSPCPCNPCPYGMVDCGERCIDPMNDKDACGADMNCLGGTECGAGKICEGGVCILNCPPELVDCGGVCVNTMRDVNFCGADVNCLNGTVCEAGERCNGGICEVDCQVGLTQCGDTCVDTSTDEAHCGSCGSPCDISEVCLAGNCERFCSENYAPVSTTGRHTSTTNGDDGDLEKGVAWPNPRFTDNGDGTVTDNLTGLIWLKDANCFGGKFWSEAISDCNGLASGQCGLTDGSSADDWRLSNVRELQSLMDYEYYQPALCNTAGTGQWTLGDPFINIPTTGIYWSSTTSADGGIWAVGIDGFTFSASQSNPTYFWPVRGGH